MDRQEWRDSATLCLSVCEFPKTHPSQSDVHDMEGNTVMLIFFVSANCKLVLKWLGDGRDIKRAKEMLEFIVILVKYCHQLGKTQVPSVNKYDCLDSLFSKSEVQNQWWLIFIFTHKC